MVYSIYSQKMFREYHLFKQNNWIANISYQYSVCCSYNFFVVQAGFLRCFRDPIQISRIGNWVPTIRENYQGKYLNG